MLKYPDEWAFVSLYDGLIDAQQDATPKDKNYEYSLIIVYISIFVPLMMMMMIMEPLK
jgi:hypothetical protein